MSYNCIGFRTNSYNSSTGENNGFYEDYRTPYVDADRMTNVIHQLLTTKSPVTIAQGGTGAKSVYAAQKALCPTDEYSVLNVTCGSRSDGSFYLRKYGSFVQFQSDLITGGNKTVTASATIPSEWRPIFLITAPVVLYASNVITGYGAIQIKTSGTISLFLSTTGESEVKCNLWWNCSY